MQLGITMDMSGPSPKLDIERVLEAERLGFSQAWTGEAYGTDAVTPAAWMLARTSRIKVGTGIMQIPGAHAGLCGDDGDDAATAVRRALPVRAGRIRAAGGGRLARRAVRQADDAHQGIHRHHSPDPGAQGTA